MKKNRLEIDYTYDFDLVGLTTSAKGYKLAWELNQRLTIRLLKKPDLVIPTRKKEEASYSLYMHESPLSSLRLFRNRPNEAQLAKFLLVPEFPHMDYIVMTQGEDRNNNRLQEELRAISSIEWVAFIPLEALKSKDYFIF